MEVLQQRWCILPLLALLLVALSVIQGVPLGNESNILPEAECGSVTIEQLDGSPSFRHPWMAILRLEFNDGSVRDACAGTLIHRRYVLSAGHCMKFKYRGRKLHSVVLGEHTKNQEIDCNFFAGRSECTSVEEFGIESSVVHPRYDSPRYSNDIGLIRLDRDVVIKDHIRPICLPTSTELQGDAFRNYIVSGWGQVNTEDDASDTLFETILPVVGNADCQRIFNDSKIQLDDNQLCAGDAESDSICAGFAGAPLMQIVDPGRLVQFAVVSYGTNHCGGSRKIPGLNTRVAGYMDWILGVIEA